MAPIVYLTYLQNTGAAFGILKGMTVLFIVLSVAAALWIGYELWVAPPDRAQADHRLQSPVRVVALSLVLGGAVGNLIDRLWRGYVVDFIDVRIWPVFNLADSAITIGVGLLLFQVCVPSSSRSAR
jgi:signal peptidase II